MKMELSVKGMTCGGCEMHVEKSVLEIEGVLTAKAKHSKNILTIQFDEEAYSDKQDALLEILKEKIQEAGYELEGLYTAPPHDFSKWQWGIILLLMGGLFYLVDRSGLMNALPVVSQSMSYGLLFIIGLMTSVHCIGMCGGINLSVSLSSIRNGEIETKAIKRARPALFYNAGRVVSYTLVGALAGALGSIISFSTALQGVIIGFAAFIMMIMGISMLGIIPGLGNVLPRMPKGLSRRIQGAGSGKGPFIIGFLNGFMPCGPLQSIQIYALGTGSALSGAISMFLFSLGTVPLMLGFGSLSTLLPAKFHSRILKISAILVLLLGGTMFVRALNLNGISFVSDASIMNGSENVRIAEISGDKQYVKTIMHGDEYEPFIVQAGIPVVWTIYADEQELNGCNNPLTVPEYGIRFQMEPGENIIEFTPPDEVGIITYTCWMGMITSGIKVVEDLNSLDDELISRAADLSQASSSSCSSGGSGGSSCCGTSPSAAGDGIGADFSAFFENPIPFISVENISNAILSEDGIQRIDISFTEQGALPAVIVLQSEIPAELNFILNQSDERYSKIYFPEYGYQYMELKEGANALSVVPIQDFTWFSWQNDLGGYIAVVEDLEDFNSQSILEKVNALNTGN